MVGPCNSLAGNIIDIPVAEVGPIKYRNLVLIYQFLGNLLIGGGGGMVPLVHWGLDSSKGFGWHVPRRYDWVLTPCPCGSLVLIPNRALPSLSHSLPYFLESSCFAAVDGTHFA